MLRRLFATAALLTLTSLAAAQTGPVTSTVFPPGAKAGETTDITVTGVGLDGNEQLLFGYPGIKSELIPGSAVVDPKSKQPAAKGAVSVKFKVTVPADANPTTTDVRVVSKSGLSNPRAFVITKLTEANEKEPNNDAAEALKVELETTINGVISTPTDVDFAAVKVKAGQNVVVACLSTSLDSRLQADLMVIAPDGKPLAANRGYRDGDAVLNFKASVDGEYLIRVAQFAYTTGGADHFYRLTVSTGPWIDAVFPPVLNTKLTQETTYGRNLPRGKPVPALGGVGGQPIDSQSDSPPPIPVPVESARESLEPGDRAMPPATLTADIGGVGRFGEPRPSRLFSTNPVILDNEDNDTQTKPQLVTPPCDIAGRIEKKNDRDWYAFEAKKGDVWTLEVIADRLGSPVDAYFVLADEKGKIITEVDDSLDSLSPNQFYTKSDDPARYRFLVPADGTYKVMVSTREAGVQFGVRDQYVLRIEKEKPDFRLAVMPAATHYPDAGTLPKGGAVVYTVFVYRLDGFDGPITIGTGKLPPGVQCPPQSIGAGQTRGSLVLIADKSAADWEGFVTIWGKSGELEHTARPFTITWAAVGVQPNQPAPNIPMQARMDRGPGIALAIRGDAPFQLTPTTASLKVKAGEKAEITLKVQRSDTFKDPIQVFSGTPGIGPKPQGNQPVPPAGTAAPGQNELKLSLDVPTTLPAGTYSVVLIGRSGTPPPKGAMVAKLPPVYPAAPVTLVVEGAPPKKK